MNPYEHCLLCPHHCGVNRLEGKKGVCNESSAVRIAWAGLHRGEEPPISGEVGSGMIFFSGCPLHCAYCQNHQISARESFGYEISVNELAMLTLDLQRMGTHTLNLVTGTHYIPSITQALDIAKEKGLTLDVVWNSSGFESLEGLRLIDPYIDLYLIDLKTLDERVSRTFCGSVRYSRSITDVYALLKTLRENTFFTDDGLLRGVLVRHLLFPGELAATEEVLRYYAAELKEQMYLSVMVQFEAPKGEKILPVITPEEYERLLALFDELEIEEGFVQELEDSLSWLPDFRLDEPFPPSFSTPSSYFLSTIKK
ncbi:MAG: radical SAM protein [Sphaerochaeta sp.]